METLLRRYFWVVNLALLAIIALLGAKVINNLLAVRIVSMETTPTAKAETIKTTIKKADTREWSQMIANRNLFNANPPEPEEIVSGDGEDGEGSDALPDGVPPGPNDPCKDSDSKISLTATMMAEPAEWSMAVVDDGEASDERIVKPGSKVGEHILVAVHRTRIVLAKGSVGFECVSVGKKGAERKKGRKRYGSTTSGAKKPSNKSNIKDGVKKVGKNSYQIDREMLDEQLTDLSTLARQARVIPHYRDGKPQGFKIVGVRPGSLYSHIGIRSGDVIKGVNDEEITSPNKALKLFEQLKNSDNVSVTLERRGRPVTQDYSIK